MKKFVEINPNFIEDTVNKVFNKLGEEVNNISLLGRGEGSAVFKIITQSNTYCLKTALFPERSEKVLNEAKIRKSFIERGLDFVPAPIYSDREYFKHGAVIFDYIEGDLSRFDNYDITKQMARNLAAIHKLEFELNPNGLDQMMKNHQFLKKTMNHIKNQYPHLMNSDISIAFSQSLQEYESIILENRELFPFGISGILHGDLSNNFITDPNGKIWLIDWENSEYGDVIEEICTFVFDNDIKDDLLNVFFKEYKLAFNPASELDLSKIGTFYSRVVPAFNICWGMDQLNTNLVHKFEPERKLRDLALSAKNWEPYFTKSTSSFIREGISELTSKLANEYDLDV